ncbi:hypothetical protein, partial [Pontibacterium sp.]|uniref:hypothetical protein n=1 Tax=Pontibacterium sp. TaxID=2036026 RepID=UPI003564CC55
MNNDKEVRRQTARLIYGLIVACGLGGILYLFGAGFVRLINEYFGVVLTRTDLEIIYVVLVVILVKA